MNNFPDFAVRKRIVCLANSRKLGGRCVAGKGSSSGDVARWIRPVSARQGGEVSESERRYADGREPRVLDIVEVPLLKPQPDGHQSENWLLDPSSTWTKCGEISWDDLGYLVDPEDALWDNSSSTWHGKSDRLTSEMARSMTDSLRLIYVDTLRLSVFAPGQDFGKPQRRVQARFRYLSHEYRLWVTDPVHETRYLRGPDREYELGACYLCISIGEPMDDGSCYKLVAAIIERNAGPRSS